MPARLANLQALVLACPVVMAALLKCTRKSDALRDQIASVTIIVPVAIHQNASRTVLLYIPIMLRKRTG
ncbi:hypothetical protein OIU74_015618 [Salix koriyanagi]|uniref:Secreted protein n=1 Tax=Salix koriyanagi TaxID=2511006 RepID=A0A9Q0SV86_9ROSI|nr:hypothetical protein OIU74_015618 [Salix koriyanagi]